MFKYLFAIVLSITFSVSVALATPVVRPAFVPVQPNVAAIKALHAQQLAARAAAARALTLRMQATAVK